MPPEDEEESPAEGEPKGKRKKKKAGLKSAEPVDDEPTVSQTSVAADDEADADAEEKPKKKKKSHHRKAAGLSKRETKKKAKDAEKAAKKKPKKQPQFRKGRFNPNVELISAEKDRDGTESTLFASCCVACSNRNPVRAVFTNNMALMRNCVNGTKQITTLFDSWSPEILHNSFYYAMVTNNMNMVHTMLEAGKTRRACCSMPQPLIQYSDTGMVNKNAYGVRVRKVQLARGGRQGNNAFMEKRYNTSMYQQEDLQSIVESPTVMRETLEKLILLMPGASNALNDCIVNAVASGNRKIAAFLIERIKGLSNYGFGDLHFQVLSLDGEDLPEFHKASIHKKAIGNCQITPIHCACVNPNPKYLQALFAADPMVQLTDDFNRKPIHYAAACESSGPLELLINTYGANPTDLDNLKRSPLHYAAMYGRAQNVKVLLEKAPTLAKARDKTGMMPLHYACKNGHVEAVKAYLEIVPKMVNLGSGPARMTPLCFAAAYNHYPLCEFLVQHKGRVLSKDKYKRTPLSLAARNGNAKILSFLLKSGSVWDDPDSSGNTPLHYAAAYGWMECAELLIKAGSNVNANCQL